jgi:predicted PurR-regulated permease PerM
VSTAAERKGPDDVRPSVLRDMATDRTAEEPAIEPVAEPGIEPGIEPGEPDVPDAAGAVPLGRRGPARMPVPPLLTDLAGWGWRLLLLAVIAWLLLRVAQQLYLVSLPVAAALLVTALLSPVVGALRRRRVPRGLATALTVIGMLAAVGGLLTWVVQRAIAEAPTLSSELSAAVQKLPISNATLVRLRGQFVDYLQSGSGSLASGVISGVQTGAEVVTGVLLTLLLTIILLADGDRIWGWLVARLPENARPRVQRAGGPAWERLSGWIRGTFVIAVFHSAVVAVTLAVLRVPLVAPLTVLVFLGSFIPLVGAVIAGGLATLVTFASQGMTAAIVLVIVLLIDNQVEAHVLQPFLVGRYVRLHPFVVAIVITAGALLGGLAGALLAVPFTAALYAALTHLPDPQPPPHRARRLPRRPGRQSQPS